MTLYFNKLQIVAIIWFFASTLSGYALEPFLKIKEEYRLADELFLNNSVFEPVITLDTDLQDRALVKSVVVRFGGRPVSLIAPNRVYTVEILADHPDGKPLEYSWHLALGAGRIEQLSPNMVIWSTGETSRTEDLRIEVNGPDALTDVAGLSIAASASQIFAGRVVDATGTPVDGAIVKINNRAVRNDPDGRFLIQVPEGPRERFVITVSKQGYQPSSMIATQTRRDLEIVLDEATTESFDPTAPISLSSRPIGTFGCRGPLSARTDWTKYPDQRTINVVQPDGSIVQGGSPASQDLLSIVEAGFGCNTVFSVAIPPDSLVDKDGNPPTGPVSISISAIDHGAPGGMPGDYSVDTGTDPATMFTVGAGNIEIYGNGRHLNLRPGMEAEISIQVAPDMREMLGGSLDPSIPLLVFNGNSGLWDVVGQFQLNGAGDTYVAQVAHFSTFNADIVKRNPSCVRIESRGIQGNYQLEYSGRAPNGAPFVRTVSIDNISAGDHVIHNLPNNTEIVLRPFKKGVPLGTFAVHTGPQQSPSTPNPPAKPYAACQAIAELFEVTNSAAQPAAPKITNVTWLDPLQSRLQLNWTHDGKNVNGFDIYMSSASQQGPYYKLGRVAASKRSEPINNFVRPCRTNWFAIVAVNGHLRSPTSNLATAKHTVTAIITTNAIVNTPPISPGKLTIGCTSPKPGALFAGVAMLNRNIADGVLDNTAGNATYLFPRFPVFNSSAGKTELKAGMAYENKSDIAIYTQFNSWLSVKRNEYLVAYTKGTKTLFSAVAGDLDDPAPLPGGNTYSGIVMATTGSKGSITPSPAWGGSNPTASGPGHIFGGFTANLFQPKHPNLPASSIAGMSVSVQFYMPLIYDDKF